MEQLERNIAVQPRVPRAVHLAARALTDTFQEHQRAPMLDVRPIVSRR